ncbi:MAG: LacI family transcriptional regulator [Chloroflexi bacterium]|nr:LacI family transcriptional regulator [Chloroflexota bacterium]
MAIPTRSKITIKDVARACGVSTQTISRVLNDRKDVSRETREKILAVMQEMDYQPSALARSMRQTSRTIGVINAEMQSIGISATLNAITQVSEKYGYSLILKELPSFETEDLRSFIQSLSAHQVQGIIYAAPEVGDTWKKVQANITDSVPPMVFLKGNPASAPITISADNYGGAYSVTRHLVEQGYRHIAHISGPLEWWEARERKRAWARALVDAGRPVPEEAVSSGDWSCDSGAAAFEVLLKKYPEVDAVFVGNDQMALGVLKIAWDRGIPVPNSLGVAGFDDIDESKYFIPSLTTVRQNFARLGEMAVRKLVSLNSTRNKDIEVTNDAIILPTELIVRQSTRRPG